MFYKKIQFKFLTIKFSNIIKCFVYYYTNFLIKCSHIIIPIEVNNPN